MENQITKKFMDVLGPIGGSRLAFGTVEAASVAGGYDITQLTNEQKVQIEELVKEHYLVKEVEWIDYVGGASKKGEAVVTTTHKLVDSDYETYEGKTAYVYQILFSPKMYDPKTLHDAVKDGCTFGPLVYNPETFIPKRKIIIEFSPEYTQEILTEENMKQSLHDKLEKVLTNPEDYMPQGFRACMLRFAAK